MSDDEAKWGKYGLEEKITEILKSEKQTNQLGKPFMTAYQIAIEFKKKYPTEFSSLGKHIGGSGTGNDALTQYFSLQLSKHINGGKIKHIEGGNFSKTDLSEVAFKTGNSCDECIKASSPDWNSNMSIFRFLEKSN